MYYTVYKYNGQVTHTNIIFTFQVFRTSQWLMLNSEQNFKKISKITSSITAHHMTDRSRNSVFMSSL